MANVTRGKEKGNEPSFNESRVVEPAATILDDPERMIVYPAREEREKKKRADEGLPLF